MYPRLPRNISLSAIARTQGRVHWHKASLPRTSRSLKLAPSQRLIGSLRMSTSSICSQSTTSDASSSRIANVPPTEPWRCHFEFDDETPTIYTFFEKMTSTWQYVVADMKQGEAIVIDPVLDYDPASGKVSTATADGLLSFARSMGLTITGIMETHAHADHLTAAHYMKEALGGNVPVGIGARIDQVQKTFAPMYGMDDPNMFQNTFDTLFHDDEPIRVGSFIGKVIHLPGHTPDHVGYVIGKAVFAGDSIFNPDVGSARADFPGGDVHDLYTSMKRLLSLPEDYRLFVGHDYPSGRDQTCSATVHEQRLRNKHVTIGTAEAEFAQWRKARDSVLGAPRLLHPSLQVNIRGGRLPPPDAEGRVWFKTPIVKPVEVKI